MKMKKTVKVFLFVLLIIIASGIIYAFTVYKDVFKANVQYEFYLLIPTNSVYNDVLDSLTASEVVQDIGSFKKTASLKKFKDGIHPGRYKLEKGMTNNQLVNLLRSGRQTPVKLTFNNIRTVNDLASKVSKVIEADSLFIIELLNDEKVTSEYGFEPKTIISMFIPNTYEFYWNTDAKKFINKMKNEYDKFWSEDRIKKAESIGLSKKEVSILASIVQAEQRAHNDEKSKVAGLYINRLNRNMLLQSDPTLIFASGDFSKKRVLNKDKDIESPYNTYKYAGLPPGPINLPERSSLDAVLNYEKHNYIFMCAKEDFSGYHNFSTNAVQHGIYARRYQQALNKKKIWK